MMEIKKKTSNNGRSRTQTNFQNSTGKELSHLYGSSSVSRLRLVRECCCMFVHFDDCTFVNSILLPFDNSMNYF